MRKIKIRVGGGCRGRLVYWAYRVYGDLWSNESSQLCSSGFRFLWRKDKLGIMCYLLGLKASLQDLISYIKEEEIGEQYLVRFYCVNTKLLDILSRPSNWLRDSMVIDVMNSIKHLSNKVGVLDLVRSKDTRIERKLKAFATARFHSYLEDILKRSHVWESADNDGYYVVYVVPSDSESIPLEFLAKYVLKKEEYVARKYGKGEVKGSIIIREHNGGKQFTRVFFYFPEGNGRLAKAFSTIDPHCFRKNLAARKSVCVTYSSANEVEDILAEVFEACLM